MNRFFIVQVKYGSLTNESAKKVTENSLWSIPKEGEAANQVVRKRLLLVRSKAYTAEERWWYHTLPRLVMVDVMELLILIVHLVAFSYGKSFTYFRFVFWKVYFARSKEMKRVDVIYANEQLLTKLSNPFFFLRLYSINEIICKFWRKLGDLPKCNIAVAYLEILNTLLYWTHCYDVSTSKLSFIQFNAFVGLPTRYRTRIDFEQIYTSIKRFVPRSKLDSTLSWHWSSQKLN